MTRVRSITAGSLLLLVLVQAASGRSQDGSRESFGSKRAHDALASAATSATPKPLVWFAPLPAAGSQPGRTGSKDYMALFRPKALWPKAAHRVRIFKIYAGWL